MTRRRFVFFVPGWPPEAFQNGITTYVSNLMPALSDLGVTPHILANVLEDTVIDEEVSNLYELYQRESFSKRLLIKLIQKAALRRISPWLSAQIILSALSSLGLTRDFDLVEMEESFGSAGFVARQLKKPLVVRLHGPWFITGLALGVPQDKTFHARVLAEGKGIARAIAVTAPSLHVLDQVRRKYSLPLSDAEVIPNPGPEISPSQRWSVSNCQRDCLLFVGRFDRLKGGDLVIDAFREIAREHPSVKLLFVGPDHGIIDGSGRNCDLPSFLRDHLPDAAIRNRVQVFGPLSQKAIAELRQRAFLALIPSRYETFSMTVLEALSFGLPLVASETGGIPELVKNGETGLLFRSGDSGDLAAKIKLLLSDSAFAATLGARGRSDYEMRFTPAVVAKKMFRFYEKVLSKSGPPR